VFLLNQLNGKEILMTQEIWSILETMNDYEKSLESLIFLYHLIDLIKTHHKVYNGYHHLITVVILLI
jgi:hypothetical protein